MKTIKRRGSVLDKVITVLYWEDTADMYMKRYMGLFNHNNSNVVEHNDVKKTAGKLQKPDWPPMGKFTHPL